MTDNPVKGVTSAAEAVATDVGNVVSAGAAEVKTVVAAAVEPPPTAPGELGRWHKFVCRKHGEVPHPVVLPNSAGGEHEFCPICLAEFFERQGVHLLERVHIVPGELQQEPAEPPVTA